MAGVLLLAVVIVDVFMVNFWRTPVILLYQSVPCLLSQTLGLK